MITTAKLTGKALLDYIQAHPQQNHTESCTGAGYLKELKDGSHGPAFTDYFEAILDARKENGEYESPKPGADWYNSLTEQDRELYDAIEDMCPEFTKYTSEQCQDFMDELSEFGITTAQQFNDAYFWQSDSHHPEADFVEYLVTELNCLELPPYLVIDWQKSWDRNYCCDFISFCFDGEVYFFHNNF
jgi:hypothetical protein